MANKKGKYCKLPVAIEAYQTDKAFDIETLEGVMHANVGDYIITGVNGEKYPCKPDIFEKTYIRADNPNKMEQVAAMFSKKLGEEFMIRDNKINLTMYARFTERGLETKDGLFDDYVPISMWLEMLLTGKAVIVDAETH